MNVEQVDYILLGLAHWSQIAEILYKMNVNIKVRETQIVGGKKI